MFQRRLPHSSSGYNKKLLQVEMVQYMRKRGKAEGVGELVETGPSWGRRNRGAVVVTV
jgi:hypothetical protein